MKVLQLGKFYPIRGGVEKVMLDLTEGLAGAGVECDMLCASFGRRSFADAQDDRKGAQDDRKCRVIVCPTWFTASGTMIAPKMISYLRRHAREYDIIHIHHPDPMAGIALWISGYKGRVILHWHSDILKPKALLAPYLPIQRWLIKRAERIVGTTPTYVKESPWLTDVQDKVTYVPIGIEPIVPDPERIKDIQEKYSHRKIVFSLGRLVPYKGYTHLIEAAKYLPEDYVILIGGTGPLREILETQIKESGLNQKVKLLGRVEDEDLPSLYGASSVFVLSSVVKAEAFGIVQIEAMSAGVPVIATKIPESGTAWVNEDGFSGLNVEPCDPEGLARAVRNICDDDQTRHSYSKNALARYERLFRSENMIKEIIKLYESQ